MECLGAKVTTDIKEALKDTDIVMGLRIQLERQKGGLFPDLREYRDLFGIDEEMLKVYKAGCTADASGPVNRGIELSTEIIDGPQSVINEQVKNGVAVRMALLHLLAEGRKTMKILIQNGRILDPISKPMESKMYWLKMGLSQRLKKITASADQIIDAKGCWVTPGLIDVHVHLREPGAMNTKKPSKPEAGQLQRADLQPYAACPIQILSLTMRFL